MNNTKYHIIRNEYEALSLKEKYVILGGVAVIYLATMFTAVHKGYSFKLGNISLLPPS